MNEIIPLNEDTTDVYEHWRYQFIELADTNQSNGNTAMANKYFTVAHILQKLITRFNEKEEDSRE
jgi:hypothetical protein